VPTQQDIPRLLALRETRRRGGLARNQNAALTEIERRFQQIAEPAAAMATGMLAEPVSGIVGMAALPFGADVAADAVRNTQQGLTYQPRTEAGQQGMQALQGFMQPIAETVSRQTDIASKVLAGNAGFDVNTPGGQFLTGMLPALAASAPGFTAARAIPGRQLEMGDIGAGGVGSRQRGMFAGVRAKTADFDALDTAKNMKGQGATRDQIWNETGWFEDVDGSWKFEIDDSQAIENINGLPTSEIQGTVFNQGSLEQALQNKDLYDNYPQIRGDEVVAYNFEGKGGQSGSARPASEFMGTPATTTLWRSGRNKSTLLHETQHRIQGEEGFARGGTPEQVSDADLQSMPQYKQWEANQGKRDQVREILQSPEYRAERDVSNRLFAEDVEPRIDRISDQIDSNEIDFETGNQMIEDIFAEFNQIKASRFPTMTRLDEIDQANKIRKPDARDFYRRLAGEAEARNVQTRRDFTPQQRRASAPWSTLDVPENELIIRRTGGNKE
jgi:hypothetical protein